MTKSRPRPGGEFKVALVGCGRISRNHFEALRKIDGLTLTAVCDVVPERAKVAAEQEGVASFTSYEEMLKRADCDVVSVCTPSGLHAAQGALAARSGKHVVTEKPMAITLGQADELVKACDDAGVFLFVVKQNRLNPPVQLLKRAARKAPTSESLLPPASSSVIASCASAEVRSAPAATRWR